MGIQLGCLNEFKKESAWQFRRNALSTLSAGFVRVLILGA
jgi:hypothetical protein